MTMSDALTKAILAMDAYNRGYSRKIELGGTGVGTASFLKESDVDPGTAGVTAGFYAVAYQIGTSKVISYRGTDALAAWPWDDKNGSDIWNGWGVGAGSPQGRQAALAFQFYKTIAGAGVDPRTANISLTGHSLGGGLAGLVGNIYGKSATMFDNMAFELAAKNTYEHSYYTLRTTYSPNLRARVYGTLSPWAPVNSYLISYYTRGEVLTNLRNFQLTAQIEVGAGLSFGSLSATDLHDMALLVIDMFGDSVVGDWKKSSYHLMPALFNNAVASAAGVGALPGTLNAAKDWSSILRQIVAYSAIDSGTTVFGDAAIRVMYNDANDLGGAWTLVAKSAALNNNGKALANTLVQYAGQVALAKAMRAAHAEALNGVLNLDGAKSRLVIDFSKNIWTLNGLIAQTSIVGRQELTEAILSSEDPRRTSGKGLSAAAFAESIGKIVLATTNVAQTITVPVATDADTVSAEKQLVVSRYSGGLAANMNVPITAICKEAA